MSKLDNKKVAKRARQKYANFADKMPDKSIKKHKKKERQEGKKEIRKDTIYLSYKDAKQFVKLMENPPDPNETLRKAIKEYNKRNKS